MDNQPKESKAEKVIDTAAKFTLGGTKNVDPVYKADKIGVIGFVTYVASLLLLIGMSYLHAKKGDHLLFIPYLVITAFGILNVMYFGWVKRELIFMSGRIFVTWNTVRHGTAVALSFLYLVAIIIVASLGWNWTRVTSPANQNNSFVQQTK